MKPTHVMVAYQRANGEGIETRLITMEEFSDLPHEAVRREMCFRMNEVFGKYAISAETPTHDSLEKRLALLENFCAQVSTALWKRLTLPKAKVGDTVQITCWEKRRGLFEGTITAVAGDVYEAESIRDGEKEVNVLRRIEFNILTHKESP